MAYRFIYFDTETTGVKPTKDRIIEIAAFDPERKKSFHRLINPEIPIPAETTAIHNISDEMVKDAPTFAEIAPDFCAFCDGEAVLVAHNNDAFDKPFLESELNRSEHPIPNWSYIDTLKWSRKYRQDLPRHSLQFLREIYGIEANQAHRALDDVLVLYEVFSRMIDDLTAEKVIELLKAPSSVTHMPFGKHQGKALNEVPKSYLEWLKDNGAFAKSENKELKNSLEKLGILSFV